MKPRVVIAETTLPDGTPLTLQEHDGRHYLLLAGEQTAGPATRVSEHEMARIACAPFRPARQPKVWLAGLGLGEALAGVAEAVPQKRATFYVAEPSEALPAWHREYFPDGVFATDKRVELRTDPGVGGLGEFDASLHAILVHADTAPLAAAGKAIFDDRRWLTAAYDALQPGGLLAIASSQRIPWIEKALTRAGFAVAFHEIDAVPKARRPRHHFLWLGRKGKADA